jgi:hypothetical protein
MAIRRLNYLFITPNVSKKHLPERSELLTQLAKPERGVADASPSGVISHLKRYFIRECEGVECILSNIFPKRAIPLSSGRYSKSPSSRSQE